VAQMYAIFTLVIGLPISLNAYPGSSDDVPESVAESPNESKRMTSIAISWCSPGASNQ